MSKSCGEDEKGFPFVNLIYYPKKNREKIKVRIEFIMMIQYLFKYNRIILNDMLYDMKIFEIGILYRLWY